MSDEMVIATVLISVGLRFRRRLGSRGAYAPRALRHPWATLAAAATVLAVAGCGATTTPTPPQPQSRATERLWLFGAVDFVSQLQSDLSLSAIGGANLATARRAIRNTNEIVSMLVAYDVFGDCEGELANAGVPAPSARPAVVLITVACRRLERATTLFSDAMSHDDPLALLAATRTATGAAPLLAKAQDELAALGSL